MTQCLTTHLEGRGRMNLNVCPLLLTCVLPRQSTLLIASHTKLPRTSLGYPLFEVRLPDSIPCAPLQNQLRARIRNLTRNVGTIRMNRTREVLSRQARRNRHSRRAIVTFQIEASGAITNHRHRRRSRSMLQWFVPRSVLRRQLPEVVQSPSTKSPARRNPHPSIPVVQSNLLRLANPN